MLEFAGDRHVGLDHVQGWTVSTVWLGINHNFLGIGPPLIYETMIFPPDGYACDDYLERYATPQQAADGHQIALMWLHLHLEQIDALTREEAPQAASTERPHPEG